MTLTQAELDQIAKALPLGIAVGDRYPDMSSVNRYNLARVMAFQLN